MALLSRRALMIVGGCVVFVVGVLLSFRPVLAMYLAPPAEFNIEEAPMAPDYTDLRFWAAHPDKRDVADIAPLDHSAADPASTDVDVFFIHPTTYFGPGRWNSDMAPDGFAAGGVNNVMAYQTSAFNECCRIFMPEYRQAHFGAFLQDECEAPFQALDLAYEDVKAAFEHFITNESQGRPFVLASHSQGTLHAQRLLAERIDGTALQDRMIVAYTIGYWLPTEILERSLRNIDVCRDRDDLNCLVTYDSFDSTGTGKSKTFPLPFWYPDGWVRLKNVPSLCVNPLSWNVDLEAAPSSLNRGGLAPRPSAGIAALPDLLADRKPQADYMSPRYIVPEATSAHCAEDGSLFISTPDTDIFTHEVDEETRGYHVYDWNFFYMNIRENVKLRIARFNHRVTAGGGTL